MATPAARFEREQGCTEVQGFLFSPPLEAPAAAALLTRERDKPRLRAVS